MKNNNLNFEASSEDTNNEGITTFDCDYDAHTCYADRLNQNMKKFIKRFKFQAKEAKEYEGKYPVVFPEPECVTKMLKNPEDHRDPKGTLINEDGTANIDVIRYELQWDAFDMSGYGENMLCDRYNNDILERFRKYGIFNRLSLYYLRAFKGSMTFYFMPWREDQLLTLGDYCGYGTEEILANIFENIYKHWEGNYRRLM